MQVALNSLSKQATAPAASTSATSDAPTLSTTVPTSSPSQSKAHEDTSPQLESRASPPLFLSDEQPEIDYRDEDIADNDPPRSQASLQEQERPAKSASASLTSPKPPIPTSTQATATPSSAPPRTPSSSSTISKPPNTVTPAASISTPSNVANQCVPRSTSGRIISDFRGDLQKAISDQSTLIHPHAVNAGPTVGLSKESVGSTAPTSAATSTLQRSSSSSQASFTHALPQRPSQAAAVVSLNRESLHAVPMTYGPTNAQNSPALSTFVDKRTLANGMYIPQAKESQNLSTLGPRVSQTATGSNYTITDPSTSQAPVQNVKFNFLPPIMPPTVYKSLPSSSAFPAALTTKRAEETVSTSASEIRNIASTSTPSSSNHLAIGNLMFKATGPTPSNPPEHPTSIMPTLQSNGGIAGFEIPSGALDGLVLSQLFRTGEPASMSMQQPGTSTSSLTKPTTTLAPPTRGVEKATGSQPPRAGVLPKQLILCNPNKYPSFTSLLDNFVKTFPVIFRVYTGPPPTKESETLVIKQEIERLTAYVAFIRVLVYSQHHTTPDGKSPLERSISILFPNECGVSSTKEVPQNLLDMLAPKFTEFDLRLLMDAEKMTRRASELRQWVMERQYRERFSGPAGARTLGAGR